MQGYYKVGTFARAIGVSKSTVRNWDNSDKLKPHHRTVSGYRCYSEDQVQECLEPGYVNYEGSKRKNARVRDIFKDTE